MHNESNILNFLGVSCPSYAVHLVFNVYNICGFDLVVNACSIHDACFGYIFVVAVIVVSINMLVLIC